jgi:lipid A 3-O-deacylase
MFLRQLLWLAVYAGGTLFMCWETAIGSTPTPSLTAVSNSDGRSDPLYGEQFPRGTWTLQADGAFIRARTNPRFEQFTGGHVGVGYYFLDRISVNADLPVYWVNQTGPSATAAGFDLLARWHFLERNHLSLFLDGGAGLLVADRDVPRGGTRFNFTPQIGIGATWLLDQHTYLFGGARLLHLSNAGINGRDRNPSVDGSLMGYVGVGWKF